MPRLRQNDREQAVGIVVQAEMTHQALQTTLMCLEYPFQG